MEKQSEVREHKYMTVVTVLLGISILVVLYLTGLYGSDDECTRYPGYSSTNQSQ